MKDHAGNSFPSASEMCRHYGVKVNTFYARRARGWTLEQALTMKRIVIQRKGHQVRDHLGNEYWSLKEMAKAYGISYSTFRQRRKRGWTLKETLTKPMMPSLGMRKQVRDHLGNEYESQKEMLEAYGVKYITYHNRLKIGMSVEEALTSPDMRGGKRNKTTMDDALSE